MSLTYYHCASFCEAMMVRVLSIPWELKSSLEEIYFYEWPTPKGR
jgi:hypothetical protein